MYKSVKTNLIKSTTKEEFMIQWVLARASFRVEFFGVEAAIEAYNTWNKIQELKLK